MYSQRYKTSREIVAFVATRVAKPSSVHVRTDRGFLVRVAVASYLPYLIVRGCRFRAREISLSSPKSAI